MAQEAEKPATEEPTPEPPKTIEDVKGAPSDTNVQTFDAAYVKELRAEAAKNRKEAADLKAQIQEHEDSQKSELEKAQAKAQKAEQATAEAAAKLLRYEVASEKEVPPKFVVLLTASTKEELEVQADLILENAKPASPDFDGGARTSADEPKSPEEAHRDTILQVLGVPKQL